MRRQILLKLFFCVTMVQMSVYAAPTETNPPISGGILPSNHATQPAQGTTPTSSNMPNQPNTTAPAQTKPSTPAAPTTTPSTNNDDLSNLPKKTEFPDKCEAKGFTYQDKLLVMQPKAGMQQVIFLIKNRKDYLVVLNRPETNPAANAGWTSPLHGQKWSAFALNQDKFSLSCLERRDTLIGYVSCQNVLKVCAFPPNAQTASTGGTYWLGEDKSLQGVLNDMKNRGIPLPKGVSADNVLGEPTTPTAKSLSAEQPPAGPPYPGTPPIPPPATVAPNQHK